MARDHQLKVSIEKELAQRFKRHCISNGVSMAEKLTQLMEAETKAKPAQNSDARPSLDTRKQRRNATQKIVVLLESIKDYEEMYAYNIPANLQGSANFEAAEQAIDALDQAVCLLNDAF